MKWLCAGPLWRGSNAAGLFKALSRQNVRIEVVDESYHLALYSQSAVARAINKALRPLQIHEFNAALRRALDAFRPDVFLVYKGAFVAPETIRHARQLGALAVNFYPDVSVFTHGRLLPQAMKEYELVFTTKTFGIADLKNAFGISHAAFIPHGFDPEIHRPLVLSAPEQAEYGCDVSFVGTYSPKKEHYLSCLKEACPGIDLKVWGSQWHRATSKVLMPSLQHREVLGDMFAVSIQASRINLGLLSEKVKGASSGDLITSRTFHIPGAGGFLLHERNQESVQYFQEDVEAAFFEGEAEMIEKVKHYLQEEEQRASIARQGHQRAWREHALDHRALAILEQVSKARPAN